MLLALTLLRARPARARPLLPHQAGARGLELRLLHDRPDRPLPGLAGRHPSAILGTIEMVALASAIAIPFGIGVALYLVEYGKDEPLRQRRPLLRRRHDRRALGRLRPLRLHRARRDEGRGRRSRAGRAPSRSRCSCSPSSRAPPRSCSTSCPTACARAPSRSARRAGGSSFRIVLPTALPGLVTGSLLAVARAAGETAPLLFTAAFVFGTQYNLSQRMNSLPLQIFNDVGQAQDRLVRARVGRRPDARRARPAPDALSPASSQRRSRLS